MRLGLPSSLISTAGTLILAGCAAKPTRSQPSASPATVGWSQNGWSGAERAEYYHLAEGSELMPYVLLSNVVSVKTGKPFLENTERFGFLTDAQSASNPHGLPIGLTAVHSRDKRHIGLEMVGFSCAACHVGELTYRGKTLLIDGAPALIDLQTYQVEFKDSVDATVRDPVKIFALVAAVDRDLHIGDTPPSGSASSYGAAATNAGDVAPAPTADKNFHNVTSRQADSTDPAAALQGKTFAERFRRGVALLKARMAYLNNGKLLLDGTEPGPGRIDAFGAARNLLFPKYAFRMRSPVSFPFLWDVPDTAHSVPPPISSGSTTMATQIPSWSATSGRHLGWARCSIR